MAMQGCDYIEAVKYCAEVLGLSDRTADRPNLPKILAPQAAAPSIAFAGSRAEELWRASMPLRGTQGERYLDARGCAIPPADGDLRFIAECYHPFEKRNYPALIALITHAVTGAPLSVHRTYLDGNGKAAIDKPKLVMKGHPIASGVVRLWPNESVSTRLTIAEGIETALTAALAISPAWACINSANLQSFPMLAGIESLLIVADHDDAGQRAAEAAGRRWADEGRDVRVWTSEREGADLNDEVTA
jgi:phage/plasmid primase-like uncharacterized protein